MKSLWITLDKKYVERLIIKLDFKYPNNTSVLNEYLYQLYYRQNNKNVDSLLHGIITFRDKEIKNYESYVDSVRIGKYNISINNKYLLEIELDENKLNELLIIDSKNYLNLKDNDDINYIQDNIFKHNRTDYLKLGFIDSINKSMIKDIQPAVSYINNSIKYSLIDRSHIQLLKRYL